MSAATAAELSLPRIETPGYEPRRARVIERYMLWRFTREPHQLSRDCLVEFQVYDPDPTRPDWLATIQQVIRDSVAPSARDTTNDGRWLNQDVADAATDFFQNTADLLPAEPAIYRSQLGELVAEFEAERGTMTSIVSPAFVLLFAVIDGVPVEKTISPSGNVRGEVREFVEQLRVEQHGPVETTK